MLYLLSYGSSFATFGSVAAEYKNGLLNCPTENDPPIAKDSREYRRIPALDAWNRRSISPEYRGILGGTENAALGSRLNGGEGGI